VTVPGSVPAKRTQRKSAANQATRGAAAAALFDRRPLRLALSSCGFPPRNSSETVFWPDPVLQVLPAIVRATLGARAAAARPNAGAAACKPLPDLCSFRGPTPEWDSYDAMQFEINRMTWSGTRLMRARNAIAGAVKNPVAGVSGWRAGWRGR